MRDGSHKRYRSREQRLNLGMPQRFQRGVWEWRCHDKCAGCDDDGDNRRIFSQAILSVLLGVPPSMIGHDRTVTVAEIFPQNHGVSDSNGNSYH